jgi:hypothetical protein
LGIFRTRTRSGTGIYQPDWSYMWGYWLWNGTKSLPVITFVSSRLVSVRQEAESQGWRLVTAIKSKRFDSCLQKKEVVLCRLKLATTLLSRMNSGTPAVCLHLSKGLNHSNVFSPISFHFTLFVHLHSHIYLHTNFYFLIKVVEMRTYFDEKNLSREVLTDLHFLSASEYEKVILKYRLSLHICGSL